MPQRPALPTSDIIARAFELAAAGHGLDEIRTQLKQEGYSNVDAHLGGPSIKSDLRKVLDRARGAESPAG